MFILTCTSSGNLPAAHQTVGPSSRANIMDLRSNRDDKLLGLLASIKETFWLEYQAQGIPDSKIKKLWGQQYVDRLAPVLSIDAPPSLLGNLSDICHDDLTPAMPVAPISPRAQGMSRTKTVACSSGSPYFDTAKPCKSRKRASSIATASTDSIVRSLHPQCSSADLASETAFAGRKMQRTASGSRTLPSVSEVLVYEDPTDYLHESGIGSYQDLPQSTVPYHGLPIGIPIPPYECAAMTTPLSGSFTQSLPLTPDSANMQNDAFFSTPMSRQDSLGVDLRAGLAMFRLDSQVSNASDFAVMPPPSFVSQSSGPSLHDLEATEPNTLLESTPPHTLTQCESSTSTNDSYDCSSTKIKRPQQTGVRNLKSVVQQKPMHDTQTPFTERLLKPKVRGGSDTPAIQDTQSMIRRESECGVSEKCQISKTPYTRPSKQKIKCPHCNKQPDGFRGDHELRRHQKLHHSNIRIGWICVDISPEQNMLSGCKHCRAEKVYGAYYNAAAHLRRVHFHPRKEGRKAHGSVSRAGKGGGDDPPMDELKRWMKQVEVTETNNHPAKMSDDGELSSEDQEQPVLYNSFNEGYDSMSSSAAYCLGDNLDHIATDAANFALTSSGCTWPSEDAWSGFRPSFAFEEANVFGLELHCEV